MSRDLTSEEKVLVELGIQAQHLLDSETFIKAVNTLSEQLTNSILSTTVDENQKRERLYMMHVALNELVGVLKNRVQAKDNIESMVNDEDDSDPFLTEEI